MSRDSAVGESLAAGLSRRLRWAVRDLWGSRRVRREVQGVSMVMPWSHRLPDYAAAVPAYGQNLVEVAVAVAAAGERLSVLDIGANIGDSTLQILNAVDARVLCVEADDAYLPFLRENVAGDERVVIERCLLVPSDDVAAGGGPAMAPVRSGGTTRFAEVDQEQAVPSVPVAELRRRHPDWADLRLVKSDTDGFDVLLGPAVARAWSDASPVLFLEFDPRLTELAGSDPFAVWGDLAALGYSHVAVWDHLGRGWGWIGIDAAADQLSAVGSDGSVPYVDVAVVHGDDAAAQEAVRALVPSRWQVPA